ncbi:MAG TPA: bifunctional shikimate kinase/3-dehydroquinate synthase [Actinomycetaceae bacterium]|nr:bifunctional shikimate kinase/3-dehydroquinate synthase [Actinomycetaceae bacterium]
MSDLVLVGLPGAGKTVVGRRLARMTQRRFVDLDEVFKERTGTDPGAFIEQRGEDEFRRIEAEISREAAQLTDTVIATGGGAIVDPISRWELWNAGPVVWLDSDDEVLAARIARGAPRPLTPDVGSLRQRRAERTPFYAAADLRVTDHPSPGQAARQISEWESRHRGVASGTRTLVDTTVRRDHPMGPRDARIMLGNGFDSGTLAGLVETYSTGTPVVVVDENVAELQPDLVRGFPAGRQLIIDAGERNKTLRSAEAMLEFASERRAERRDAWVAIGGGTTGDLVGTAAALYMRGAPLVQVPTTWLAMADAAIGGKVGVDLAAAKNSAGAFWPPVAVVADMRAIDTLPWERRLDGMAECLKSGVIGDPWLWDVVTRRGVSSMATGEDADLAARYAIIERSALLKLRVADRDPFEAGERRSLNLGHTIGHALEIESGYTLPHGRAVVLGLRAVAHIALGRGAPRELAAEIDEVVATLGFATHRSFDPAAVTRALSGDKKSEAGRIRWILPLAIGEVIEANDVTEDEVSAALEHIQLRD